MAPLHDLAHGSVLKAVIMAGRTPEPLANLVKIEIERWNPILKGTPAQ